MGFWKSMGFGVGIIIGFWLLLITVILPLMSDDTHPGLVSGDTPLGFVPEDVVGIESFTPVNEAYMIRGFQVPANCNPTCYWEVTVATSEKIIYVQGKYNHTTDEIILNSIKEGNTNGDGYWRDGIWSDLWKLVDDDLVDFLPIKNKTTSCTVIPSKECPLDLGDTRTDGLYWLEISTDDMLKRIEYSTGYASIEQGTREYQWIDASGKKITKILKIPTRLPPISQLDKELGHIRDILGGHLE